MVVRLKGAVIESIEETETKRLRVLRATSKEEGASILVELPDVLCEKFKVRDALDVVIDSEAIQKGESSDLYAEGIVFKRNEAEGLEIVGTIGGLRLVLNMADPKPAQKKTFSSDKFFLALN